jgi:hypothetical protein
LKRYEEALVDCLPKPQFDSYPPVEELRHVLRVHALWRGGQPEQFHGVQAIEKSAVARRRCVMELVDDDDVEVIRLQPGHILVGD